MDRRELILNLLEQVEDNRAVLRKIDFSYGRAGLSVLYLQLARYFGDPAFQEKAEMMIGEIFSDLEQGYQSEHQLKEISELATMLCLYEPELGQAIDVKECLEQLDEYISVLLDEALENRQYDPYSGAFAAAGYLLHRAESNPEFATGKLALLYQTILDGEAIHHNRQLSISHGFAYYLRFLLRTYDMKVHSDVTLIKKFIDSLTCGEWDFEEHTCFFPATLEEPRPAPLNICYGDAGILHALVEAARSLNDLVMERNMLLKLRRTTQRREEEVTGVRDNSVIYGSTGLYLFFNKLYRAFPEDDFSEASEYWSRHAVTFAKAQARNTAPHFFFNQNIPYCRYSMAEGLIGVITSLVHQEVPDKRIEPFIHLQ